MSLEQLSDMDWVKANLWLVFKAYQLIDKQLTAIKDEVKFNWEDKQYWDVTAKYSKYVKLKPRDIDEVLSRYPVTDYPQVYNISLSKEAQHVITDEDLFDTVEITSVRIELPE